MKCEFSYYPMGNEKEKPNCCHKTKIREDKFFKEKCPLIYWCPINERYEQTFDLFGCKYRGIKNE